MIDHQLDVFPGQDRFESAVLGLRSTCAQLARALELPREDGGKCEDGPLLDFLLGAVSFARTLQAVLDVAARAPRAEPVTTTARAPEVPRWLR